MSYYHDLARPMEKKSWQLAKTVGKSLFNKGFWQTAARGGEMLAARGGKLGTMGRGIELGAGAMHTAAPALGAYGIAGMVAQPFGIDLPGSELAFNAGMPGWGALVSAPSAIRSARLATGKYDGAVADDAKAGAGLAGQHWITATQMDGRNATDPAAYQKFLQENGINTAPEERYFSDHAPRQPGTWQQLGNIFTNPTANVVPRVQQQFYDQMHKGASSRREFIGQLLKGIAGGSTVGGVYESILRPLTNDLSHEAGSRTVIRGANMGPFSRPSVDSKDLTTWEKVVKDTRAKLEKNPIGVPNIRDASKSAGFHALSSDGQESAEARRAAMAAAGGIVNGGGLGAMVAAGRGLGGFFGNLVADLHKGASADEMEKEAMANAARGAWNLSRAVGASELGNGLFSALRAGKAGWQASRPAMFMAAHPSVAKWTGHALTGGMVGMGLLDGVHAMTDDKPYDPTAVQQEGYNGGQAAIRDRMAHMTPFERRMAQMDPSLAVQGLENALPGTVSAWEQNNGQQYHPGILGGIAQAWNGRGTPNYYSTDANGMPHYL